MPCLSDIELRAALDEVFGCRARLDGLASALVRELDGRGLAARDGATNTPAWLAGRERISGSTASRSLRVAKAVDGTATGEALLAGQVNAEQAEVIARAVAAMVADRRVEAEKALLEHAAVFGPRQLAILGDRIAGHIDTATSIEGTGQPSPAELAAARQLELAEARAVDKRELWLTDTHDGWYRISGRLDGEGAAVVRSVFDALCRPCPADRVEPRSPARKRADAFVETCQMVLTSGRLPRNGGDPVQVVVTVPLATLRDQVSVAALDDGTVLSAAAARRVACDAGLIPAVIGGASQPLDVGRQRRLVTGPLRRAVLLRDRGCAFPGCDRSPSWTSIHHVIHWADSGTTCLANSVALCGHHTGPSTMDSGG